VKYGEEYMYILYRLRCIRKFGRSSEGIIFIRLS